MNKKKSCSCTCIVHDNENGNTNYKSTLRADDQKTKLINRLSRIEGQVRGLKKMVEDDTYCYDILTQSAATSSALNSFSKELLNSHVHGCVVRDIQAGDTEVVDELMDIMQKLMK